MGSNLDISDFNSLENRDKKGTLSFKINNKTYLHILRKETKVTFSVRELQELEDHRLYGTGSPQKKELISRWVTIVSFSAVVSKKGLLNSFLSRTLSKSFSKNISALNIPYSSNIINTLELVRHLGKNRVRQASGVINTKNNLFSLILILCFYVDSHVGKESDSVCAGAFIKELRSLLRRNSVERETLEDSTLEDLSDVSSIRDYGRAEAREKLMTAERYITSHTYPISKFFPDVQKQIEDASYDSREALSMETLDEFISRLTYKREHKLRETLRTYMLSFADRQEIYKNYEILDLVNALTLTKSYVPDSERIELVDHLLGRDRNSYRDIQTIQNTVWELLRYVFKEAREDGRLREEALELLRTQRERQYSDTDIKQLYGKARSKNMVEEPPDLDIGIPVVYLSNHSHKLLYMDKLGRNLGDDLGGGYSQDISMKYVPNSWPSFSDFLPKLGFQLLRLPNGKTNIPLRVVKSYRKHFSKASEVGYYKEDILSFLLQEREFIKRKLRRYKIAFNDEILDDLLGLSMSIFNRSLSMSRIDSSRIIAEIPDKVLFAIRDNAPPEIVHDVLLTELQDYETISATFALLKEYRHAILDIKVESPVFF